MVFSGRFFDAEEALGLGLIDEMVGPDDVYDAAAAWARRFLDGPRHALAAAKAGINDVFELGPAERAAAERRRYVEVFAAGHSGELGRPRARDSKHSSTAGETGISETNL